jgi:hypothetical protein
MDNIRVNINKIHSNISSLFENVSVEEKSDKRFGNYFEILVNEDKLVKIILDKRNICEESFNWSYFSNPDDENSHLIERISNIESIKSDILEILSKNRFDGDYLNK